MKDLVVFASGGGSNFKNILKNTKNNKIKNCQVSLLVSNNSNSNAILHAKENKIDTFIINYQRYPNNENYVEALNNKISEYDPALIILAGYMKLIPKEIVLNVST